MTRKLKDITEALGGTSFSKSHVSELDEEVCAWRHCSVDKQYPYLIACARYEKVHIHNRVVSQGVLMVFERK